MANFSIGSVDNLSSYFWAPWLDCIVPFSVEFVAQDVQVGHFLVGDFDPGGIEVFIELATDGYTHPGHQLLSRRLIHEAACSRYVL
jgi:hypothetical protein